MFSEVADKLTNMCESPLESAVILLRSEVSFIESVHERCGVRNGNEISVEVCLC